MRSDIVVLGAGIIGVSTALHLQRLGRSVTIVDRTGVAAETSSGNAGIIERASVVPYAFPRSLSMLMRYALNRRSDARYDVSFLPKLLPWLAQYWWHSAPNRLAEASAAMLPLIEHCLAEHEALMAEAGTERFLRRTGWVEVYRSEAALAAGTAEAATMDGHGLVYDVLDAAGLRAVEPNLSERLAGGVLWHDPATVSDPGAVTRGYADLFVARGGQIQRGDARSLAASGSGWSVTTDDGPLAADAAVLALGPWSDDVFRGLGYRIPLAVKRGYHMHYAPAGNASLARPVLDAEGGYVLAPMTRGIRLTTGVEFAGREAPASPIALDRCEPMARTLFPLGERVDAIPWLGRRPALPDMRPVIGPAPRHKGLWFAFGHAHHGFTLGPITGRLIAEMMTGLTPVVNPAPYRADRFA